MKAFFASLEVVVKILIALLVGTGVGTLVFGVGLLMLNVSDFSGPGPPPGPAFIGLGTGLLTAGVALLGMFVGPLSRWQWFVSQEPADALPKKWKSAG